MKFLDNFKPSKKVRVFFISRHGTIMMKKKVGDNGKIYHEGKSYAYTSKQVYKVKGKPTIFFFEDNPLALVLDHQECPIMDAEGFNIALKMEAIKAIEDVEDTRRKETMITLFMLAAVIFLTLMTTLKVYELI